MTVTLDLDGISPTELPIENLETTALSPLEEKTNLVAQEIILDVNRVIDPARAAVLQGAILEQDCIEKIKVLEDKTNEMIQSIDLLLDLSRETGKLNAEKPVLNDTIISLVQQLKNRGINLLDIPEGKEIDKEQLAVLKSSLGSHLDKLRTEVQQIFTKMQTFVQNMSSINDTIKKMISEQSDLIRKIQERSLKR